jgi:xanthine dehydrogenase/oxidase
VAAQALGVPTADVHIAECASDRVHNTSPTAASMGADLNGMAVLHACEQIASRLRPLRTEFPALPFREICALAYKRQIPLAAHGFYASPYGGVHRWRSAKKGEHLPGADRSAESNRSRGDIFNYFGFGAAVAEVELDVLSGLFEVVRADLLMDVGHSLNPAVDIGQVGGLRAATSKRASADTDHPPTHGPPPHAGSERPPRRRQPLTTNHRHPKVEGAFVQGMGRWTMEELRFERATGALATDSPHTYFVPSAADVPRDLRVALLGDAPNKVAVHSSKAVGEPPFFLSSCVYFALKVGIFLVTVLRCLVAGGWCSLPSRRTNRL